MDSSEKFKSIARIVRTTASNRIEASLEQIAAILAEAPAEDTTRKAKKSYDRKKEGGHDRSE
jgi:hypothetical protein